MSSNWDSPGAQPDPAADGGRRLTKRHWQLIVGGVILLLAGLVVWRLTANSRSAEQARGRFSGITQPVGVATVSKHDIRVILNQIGTVVPLATVTVQAQIAGVLMQIGFKEGQLVHKGDFLAQIDPRPYQIALEQYQAQLLKDQAALKQAQTDLERYRALLERDSIAKQTVDDQVWLVQQDEGLVRVDQAQIDQQRLNLTYCHIVSPVDGRVGLRQVDVGNYVTANSSNGIVVVTQLQPISAVFTVPEDQVPTVLEEFHANGPLQALVFDRTNLKQLATGTLGAVDTQVDTTTGTVKMRALFDNANNVLYPQQFVNVQLLVKVIKDAVVVPKTAVQYGTQGPFVYALDEDNKVSVKNVKTGVQDGELIALTDGVALGDRVVTDGADQLKSGVKVTIRGDGAGAAGGPGAPGPGDAGQHPRGQRGSRAGAGAAPAAGAAAAGDGSQRRHRDPNAPSPPSQGPK